MIAFCVAGFGLGFCGQVEGVGILWLSFVLLLFGFLGFACLFWFLNFSKAVVKINLKTLLSWPENDNVKNFKLS